ncbi:MAG: F0F1 ATP synthase subunit gamma, partial [Planctomycetes bacterium]|nr:F0F1 ATP synthase subunit gamma [Planctomycetota bacterium]
MAKARKILSRLAAVKNVRTVTFAMEAVARSRFRKIHAHAASVRAYAAKLTEMVEDIALRCKPRSLNYPLLRTPEKGQDQHAIIVLTSNRGLCAGFNSSVLSLASERIDQLEAAGISVRLRVVGQRGIAFFRRHE